MRVHVRALVCVAIVGLLCAFAPNASADDIQTLGFRLSPRRGPPGTTVRFEGEIPSDSAEFENYRETGYGFEALDVPGVPDDCALIVPFEHETSHVTDTGHVTGSFIVGSNGGCVMESRKHGTQPARPGVYGVLLSCHACTPAATFTVTSTDVARTGTDFKTAALVGVASLVLGMALTMFARRFRGVNRLRTAE